MQVVQNEVVQKLLAINRLFYQTFAEAFDATRQRVQPGVARVLDSIPKDARILDLGCGNGEVARELARRGFAGSYVGVDFSEGLVEAARKRIGNRESKIENRETERGKWEFRVADLTEADWEKGLEGPFDVVFAFAVLHHLPSPFHAEIARKVCALLGCHSEEHQRRRIPGARMDPLPTMENFPLASRGFLADARNDIFEKGVFIFSNWQFLNSPRWQARIQPWERVGLTTADVDPNDYLLDWRSGGEGLRYVHHFSPAELANLAQNEKFEIAQSFSSDGKEGNLALYQIWRPQ